MKGIFVAKKDNKNFKKIFILPLIISLALLFYFKMEKVKPAFAQSSIYISPELLKAVIFVESSNNPRAHNRYTQARGLTQITPIAWKELKKHHRHKYAKLRFQRHMHNPYIATEAGRDFLYILQSHLKARKIPVTLDNLLASYVWGVDNLDRHGLTHAPRVVKRYIRNVKRLSREYALDL